MKKLAVVGTGRIGTHHALAIARDVYDADLVGVVDPIAERAQQVAEKTGAKYAATSVSELLTHTEVDGVVLTSPAATHLEQVRDLTARGLNILCEKPLATSLSDALEVVEIVSSANVIFQVAFNRRFARSWQDAKQAIVRGEIGKIERISSTTRDPGPFKADPNKVADWTIFNETLIHDFDTILWLNEGARPVQVFTAADALVAPEAKPNGFLDSSVVTITFDNGAIATAEASFRAMYGYDLRGEVFGSKGMASMGGLPNTAFRLYTEAGMSAPTEGTDESRFHASYVAEIEAFIQALNGQEPPTFPTVYDGLAAQCLADAAIRSYQSGAPVTLEEK